MTNKILNNTLAILIIFSAVACGKKITNIFPSSGSNTPGQAIAPPTNNNSGNTGNGGSTINPGGGSSDSGGGDPATIDTETLNKLISSEIEIQNKIIKILEKIIRSIGLSSVRNMIIEDFFIKMSELTQTNCNPLIIQSNLYTQNELTKLYLPFVIEISQNNSRPENIVEIKSPFKSMIDLKLKMLDVLDYRASIEEKRSRDVANPKCTNHISDYISSIKFEIKEDAPSILSHPQKFTADKNRTATFSEKNNQKTICISKKELRKVPLKDSESTIYSLILHEIGHSVGFDEKLASELEKAILNYDLINVNSDLAELISKNESYNSNFASLTSQLANFYMLNSDVFKKEDQKISCNSLNLSGTSDLIKALQSNQDLLLNNLENDSLFDSDQNTPKTLYDQEKNLIDLLNSTLVLQNNCTGKAHSEAKVHSELLTTKNLRNLLQNTLMLNTAATIHFNIKFHYYD